MTDNKDGWIEWKGGECPVPEGVRVEVVFRDFYGDMRCPETFRWGHKGDGSDIIAYRIIGPFTYQHEDGKPAADMEEF